MWRGSRGVHRTLSKSADANLDCAFVENALLFVVLKFGRALAPLSTSPDHTKENRREDGMGGDILLGHPWPDRSIRRGLIDEGDSCSIPTLLITTLHIDAGILCTFWDHF